VLVAHPGSDSQGALFLVLLTCDQRGRVAEVLALNGAWHRLAAARVDAWLSDEQRRSGREAFAPFCFGRGARGSRMKRRPAGFSRRVGPSRAAVGWALHPAASSLAERFCPGRGQARGGHCAGIVIWRALRQWWARGGCLGPRRCRAI